MIHINIDGKKPPDDWCRRAEELAEKLKKTGNNEERKRLIKSYSYMWKELKAWLLQLSHDKCWYSEAKELVSDYHVDHFRPKNRAKQLDGTEREGYWWLAFDWRNYRIAGSICNSPHYGADGELRGKADFFPLKDGSPVASNPTCDLEDEIICLLDPTDPDDPVLLTFDESGYPLPAALEETWEYIRAKESIKLFYLDYRPLVDERKKIWTKCDLSIDFAQNLMQEQSEISSVTTKNKLKNEFRRLREMISEEAELSSTARACLLSSGIPWARNLVLNS